MIAGAVSCRLAGWPDAAGAAGTISQQLATSGPHSGPGAETSCSGQHGAHCGPAIARALGSAHSTTASARRVAIRSFIGMSVNNPRARRQSLIGSPPGSIDGYPRRSRSALAITETEERLIAAAAIIGFSRMPNPG